MNWIVKIKVKKVIMKKRRKKKKRIKIMNICKKLKKKKKKSGIKCSKKYLILRLNIYIPKKIIL